MCIRDSHSDIRAIVLDAPDACPRYSGRIIRGVDAKAPTPEWMKQRLARSGVRSISALVDVTNYVMLELGQPLHAFDEAKLNGAIHVRFPAAGEQVLLLNGQTVTPAVDTLLIADESRALALAGVMGGEDSGITPVSYTHLDVYKRQVDRKVLADLAVFDKPAFAALAEQAKAQLAA